MTYEQLFEASTHSALYWLDLSDGTVEAAPQNRQAIMAAMTLPGLTQEANCFGACTLFCPRLNFRGTSFSKYRK